MSRAPKRPPKSQQGVQGGQVAALSKGSSSGLPLRPSVPMLELSQAAAQTPQLSKGYLMVSINLKIWTVRHDLLFQTCFAAAKHLNLQWTSTNAKSRCDGLVWLHIRVAHCMQHSLASFGLMSFAFECLLPLQKSPFSTVSL